jgi:4-hydroxybenzoyl-CoA reductase subunit beta
MNLPHFDYHTPVSLDECAGLIKKFGEQAVLVAGGTDLYMRMKHRLVTPSHVVSLARIPGMQQISFDPARRLTLGATVHLSVLAGSHLVKEKYPALAEAASLVATGQIRNAATLAGNVLQETRCLYYNRSILWKKGVPSCIKCGGTVCHSVPQSKRCFAVYQGDIAPVLIVLRGKVVLHGDRGPQDIPVEDIFTGQGKDPFKRTDRKIVSAFTVPALPPSYTAYRKYRLRDGIDFPLAGCALALQMDGKKVMDLRICLTGIGSSPILIEQAGEIAHRRELTPTLVMDLSDAAFKEAHPVANLGGSPNRRRLMIRQMVQEMLNGAVAPKKAK